MGELLHHRFLAGALGLALLVVGCSASTPQGTAESAAPVVTTARSTPSVDTRTPITGAEPVTMAFAGDIHFEYQLRSVGRDPQGLAQLRPYFDHADVAIANLETAITDRGTPIPGKAFTFRAPVSALTTVKNAGIDAVGMSNNHAVDFGKEGLADTLAARATSPVTIMGIGANEDEAFKPAVFEVDGVSIAVINASQLTDETSRYFTAGPHKAGIALLHTPHRFVAEVKAAQAKYDVVIAYLHWGTEKVLCPTQRSKNAVRWLTAAGVDAIIGGHSHRVQAGGWQGSTYINYGLGNFVWWKNASLGSRSTGVLTISIDKEQVKKRRALPADQRASVGAIITQEQWTPLEIRSSGIPTKPFSVTAESLLAARNQLRQCSNLTGTPGH